MTDASTEQLDTLRVTVLDGVAKVVIDHPPINLFDRAMIVDFLVVGARLEADPEVRCVVIESADPEFFIAHADVGLILELPRDQGDTELQELNTFHQLVDRFRTMPKATIAKLAGIVRGGGSELALSVDMRFATPEAVLAQPEVAVGILPGGSGTQRLPRLIGRGRALEVILGCADIDAVTAEAWGWVNRVLPVDELDDFVDRLARRIAAFPPAAVAEAKAAVSAAEPDPVPGLLEEAQRFNRLLADPVAIQHMQAFLDLGGQTREVERQRDAFG